MSRSFSPIVSICIPTCNGARRLRETIRSALAQTFTDLEVIVSDDASTDDTLSVASAFAAEDPRVRVIPAVANCGIGANWNRAVSLSRGRYLKLLCQDDLLYPQCVARQVEAIEVPANAGVALVACRRDVVHDDGRVAIRGWGMRGWAGRIDARRALRRICRSGNPIGEPAVGLFRRDAFDRAGGYRDALPYLIDVDLWARLLFAGDLYALPETLCAFRLSSDSLSRSLARVQARQTRAFITQLRATSPAKIPWPHVAFGAAAATLRGYARRAIYRGAGQG